MLDTNWLPDKRYYEYAYHKFFNPDTKYEDWTPWDQWTYPDRDILRFSHIIKNQTAHIKGKTVLDVACHLGYISLFCLHNNATFVTGTNVRERELEIGQEVITLAGYKNFELIMSDLNDYAKFTQLCNRHNTVVFSGIMYHIQNHYEILKTVYESSAEVMIIEGLQPVNNHDCELPCIFWVSENTNESTNALTQTNKPTAFVGIPTREWVRQAAVDIGWNIIYDELISYTKPNNKQVSRYIITVSKQKDKRDI